jgi:hypothetical protein
MPKGELVVARLRESVFHESLGAKHEDQPGVDSDIESDGLHSADEWEPAEREGSEIRYRGHHRGD